MLIAVPAAMIAFWGWMFVDLFRRKWSDGDYKMMWVIFLVFANVIGAFLYFVLVRLGLGLRIMKLKEIIQKT